MRRAWSSRNASFAGVATRSNARTFEYETEPRWSASPIAGNPASLRATRTRSRAVTRSQPTRQASQCAHDIAPWTCQPAIHGGIEVRRLFRDPLPQLLELAVHGDCIACDPDMAM
jgi:hypothetical protein